MIYKLQSPKPDHVRVIFELPSCIWADRICLTGDFNGWDESSHPMRQSRSGVWRAEIDLPAGQRSEFRYVIDGHWQTDYHADGFTGNIYGADNSVVIAELPPAQVACQQSEPVQEESAVHMHTICGPADRAVNRVPWLARPRPAPAVESAA